ncbi:MAG: SnoaL-like domain [Solirubrobacteraceae bacterium]|jgi:ketosteroid isomerase-like protein|nr:SnoaL-like domain [Solirubrobacteraceae bacterium]
MATALSPEILDRLKIQERFDCWNRDEFELMEEMYAEDAVFDVSAVFTDVPPLHGKPSIRRYWHELRQTWAGLRLDPVQVLDVGDGRYVAELRLWGKGKGSGAEVEQRLAMLYAFRAEDRKATSIRLLPDMATALREAEASPARTA